MRRGTPLLTVLTVALLTGCAGDSTTSPPSPSGPGDSSADAATGFERLPVTTTDEYPASSRIEQWRAEVPELEELSITSTADGTAQPAFFVPPPEDDGPAPLLVVLHSWSSDWQQENGIPYAQFAAQEGWAMMAPDFRGVNERPESTGSDLVVQDVLDAVDEAGRRADVDPEHVYLVGFSGGGHLSLLMTGRHPDRFAGAVSWVPIHDLTEWYTHNVDRPEEDYAEQIVASCGGDPSVPGQARQECLDRSPVTHLEPARDDEVAYYLAAGIDDRNVPPDHTLEAFNQLAPDAAVDDAAVAAVADNVLPAELTVDPDVDTFFEAEDPDVLFSRSADDVTVVLFEAGHAMVFNPGMAWLVDQASD